MILLMYQKSCDPVWMINNDVHLVWFQITNWDIIYTTNESEISQGVYHYQSKVGVYI